MRSCFRHYWIYGLAFAVGCQSQSDMAQPGDFGRFEGEVVASWDDNGRHMTLREDFAYVDPQKRRWVAPAGTVVDGASIPRGFWTVIGGPFEGRYRHASVVHDIGCDEMLELWEDVHRMFYDACRCGGVDETQAKMMYYAVYHFGPRWERVTETQLEWQPGDDGQMVQGPVLVETAVRIDPPEPTPEEVDQVVEFIAEENPTVTSIKKMDRESLHRRPRRNRPSGLGKHSGRPGPERIGEWPSTEPRGGGTRQRTPQQPDMLSRDVTGRNIRGRANESAASPVRKRVSSTRGGTVGAKTGVELGECGVLITKYLRTGVATRETPPNLAGDRPSPQR